MGQKCLHLTAFGCTAPINQWITAPLIYLFTTVHLHLLQRISVECLDNNVRYKCKAFLGKNYKQRLSIFDKNPIVENPNPAEEAAWYCHKVVPMSATSDNVQHFSLWDKAKEQEPKDSSCVLPCLHLTPCESSPFIKSLLQNGAL